MTDAHSSSVGRPLSDAKREKILAAARRVFLEDGFDGASMQHITALSGVSKATVYNHFPSKENLFEAVMLEQVRKLREQTFSVPSEVSRPEDVLFGLGVGLVSGLLEPQNMKMARQLISDSWRFPHLGRAFMEEGPVRGTQMLAAYLQSLCDQGVLRIEDTTLAAQQFGSLAEVGQADRAHMTGEFPSQAEIAQRVKSAVRLFMRGYAP
jgi:AcrR family transcriptional regulator